MASAIEKQTNILEINVTLRKFLRTKPLRIDQQKETVMKKQFARTVIIALVVLASMVSYVYLNTVDLNVTDDSSSQFQLMENEEASEEESADNTKLLLPDVTLIKKVIETGRSLVPGT